MPAVVAVAAAKLATVVVDDTTNGAVPVATVDISCPVTAKLPALALPVAFRVPDTLTPVPVTTSTLALPFTDVLTLPFETGILTFEVPLAILVPVAGLAHSSVLPVFQVSI